MTCSGVTGNKSQGNFEKGHGVFFRRQVLRIIRILPSQPGPYCIKTIVTFVLTFYATGSRSGFLVMNHTVKIMPIQILHCRYEQCVSDPVKRNLLQLVCWRIHYRWLVCFRRANIKHTCGV